LERIGTTVFEASRSLQPARHVNVVVRPLRWHVKLLAYVGLLREVQWNWNQDQLATFVLHTGWKLWAGRSPSPATNAENTATRRTGAGRSILWRGNSFR